MAKIVIFADFSYYASEYFGDMITDEKEFAKLALKASAYINTITYGRIEEPISEAVRMATCAVTEILQGYESGEAGIASATIGKKSITYANADQKTLEKDIYKAAYPFLVGTGLLYRGVYD